MLGIKRGEVIMPNNRATSEQIIEDLEEERLEQLLGLNEHTLQSLSKSIDKLIHTAQGGEE